MDMERSSTHVMKRLLIIVLLLAVLGAVVYRLTKKHQPAPSGEVAEIFSAVPSGAVAIAYVDLSGLRNSAFWQKTIALFPEQERDPEFKRFVVEAGFDYERDLDRVVIGWRLMKDNQLQVTAIADGRFDRAKLRAYAQRHGSIEIRDGAETFLFDGEKRRPVRLRFLTDTRVALTEAGVEDTPAEAGAKSPLDKSMAGQVAAVSGATIFTVIRVEALPKMRGGATGPFDSLQDLRGTVDWLTLAARPEGARLRVQLQGQAPSTFKAMQAGILLDGFKLFATSALRNANTGTDLGEQEREALLDLLERTQIIREGAWLRARFELTHELIKRLVKQERNDTRRKTSIGR